MHVLRALFGGGGSQPKASSAPAPAPAAAAGSGGSAAASSGLAPGTPDQQTAYYQNMLAGLGIGEPGGNLPQDLQSNISKQASLVG